MASRIPRVIVGITRRYALADEELEAIALIRSDMPFSRFSSQLKPLKREIVEFIIKNNGLDFVHALQRKKYPSITLILVRCAARNLRWDVIRTFGRSDMIYAILEEIGICTASDDTSRKVYHFCGSTADIDNCVILGVVRHMRAFVENLPKFGSSTIHRVFFLALRWRRCVFARTILRRAVPAFARDLLMHGYTGLAMTFQMDMYFVDKKKITLALQRLQQARDDVLEQRVADVVDLITASNLHNS
ncbi:MAG: hypothetical protein KGL39_10470 [Patescibacteria group bacterium]|nr:hypothetical protein [Patescibacteria group bacterium]